MYYDYDFSEMVSELEDLNETASEILTQLKSNEEAELQRFEQLNVSLSVITGLLVILVGVRVIFHD